MTILVTGGAGFIGSHIVDRLVNDGIDVKVLDNLSTGNMENIRCHVNSGSVEFLKGDIRDTSVVKQAVEGVSTVVHLAAQISVAYSIENPEETYNVNTSATQELLQASAQAGIKRFVFASSCAVYGDSKFLPITERHPTNPLSSYADSKLKAEKHCLDFHEKHFFESVVLRFFNVYGQNQGLNDYSGVITKFISNIKQCKPLTIYGDGTQTRDFVNVSDIVGAIKTSMNCSKAAGETIHIGTGKPISINELAETLLQIADSHVGVNHQEARAGEIKQSYADISKAANLLGYKPLIPLSKGLGTLLSSENH